MNRIKLFLVTLLAMTCVFAYSDEKEYAVNPQPDSVYFVNWLKVPAAAGTYTYTNNDSYMWWMKYKVVTAESTMNTVTVNHVSIMQTPVEKNTIVVTNDFGNVQTNWVHGITNTTTVYLTNRLDCVTNGGGNVTIGSSLEGDFIQKGDLLIFTTAYTNSPWIKINGMR